MQAYFLRHGIAEDRAASGRDADRRLTEDGREKLRRVLERAQAAGVNPSLILSSPLKRAVETAEIAGRELGYDGKILRVDCLAPESAPPDIWAELRKHRDQAAILLAGHEPLLSTAVSWMLGATRAMVDFRKAGLIRIDFDSLDAEPKGILQWMLIPKLA